MKRKGLTRDVIVRMWNYKPVICCAVVIISIVNEHLSKLYDTNSGESILINLRNYRVPLSLRMEAMCRNFQNQFRKMKETWKRCMRRQRNFRIGRKEIS